MKFITGEISALHRSPQKSSSEKTPHKHDLPASMSPPSLGRKAGFTASMARAADLDAFEEDLMERIERTLAEVCLKKLFLR